MVIFKLPRKFLGKKRCGEVRRKSEGTKEGNYCYPLYYLLLQLLRTHARKKERTQKKNVYAKPRCVQQPKKIMSKICLLICFNCVYVIESKEKKPNKSSQCITHKHTGNKNILCSMTCGGESRKEQKILVTQKQGGSSLTMLSEWDVTLFLYNRDVTPHSDKVGKSYHWSK